MFKLGSVWLVGWALLSAAAAQAEGLVLWNKLGSAQEILNSEFGPDGTIVGSSHAYEAAMFGAGYVRKDTGENYVEFPSSIVDQVKSRGAIEEWINPKVAQPQAFQYGIFGLVGTPYAFAHLPSHSYSNFEIYWGDGATGGHGLVGALHFDGQQIWMQEQNAFVATPGVPFHVALSWDVNGIGGTNDTMRVYRDGIVVARTSTTWNPGAINSQSIVLGYGPDGGGYDKFITDNIKIWDYPRTDFSDRFTEGVNVVPMFAAGTNPHAYEKAVAGLPSGAGFESVFTFTLSPRGDVVANASFTPLSEPRTGATLFDIRNFKLELFKEAGAADTVVGAASGNGQALQSWDFTPGASFLEGGEYYVRVSGVTAGTMPSGYDFKMHVTAVPEPGTWALMAAGLGVFGFAARRRRRR